MIMTANELRQLIDTTESDQVLEMRIQGLEYLIRAYTNNNFQHRAFRAVAVAVSAENRLLINSPIPFEVGDTLQITESELQQDALVTVVQATPDMIAVNEPLFDESGIVITKVKYPIDIKLGVANLIKWELANRDKVGIASESISRHSVTYFNMDGDNSLMGYPKSLLGFLKPYRKARIGKGGAR